MGRIIKATRGRAVVIPVFINGLSNDSARQVAGNYLKTGGSVTVVFGHPIDFEGVLDGPDAEQRLSDRALDAVRALREEERTLRAQLP